MVPEYLWILPWHFNQIQFGWEGIIKIVIKSSDLAISFTNFPFISLESDHKDKGVMSASGPPGPVMV